MLLELWNENVLYHFVSFVCSPDEVGNFNSIYPNGKINICFVVWDGRLSQISVISYLSVAGENGHVFRSA